MMLKKEKLKEAALRLERAVEQARSDGYTEASCVLTPEVEDLIKRIKAGELTDAVKLEFTAGVSWHFFETKLGECRDLENAWGHFLVVVEDRESDPRYVAVIRSIEALIKNKS